MARRAMSLNKRSVSACVRSQTLSLLSVHGVRIHEPVAFSMIEENADVVEYSCDVH